MSRGEILLGDRGGRDVAIDECRVGDIDVVHRGTPVAVGATHFAGVAVVNVGHIDAVYVDRTCMIPGDIGLPWAEREPRGHAYAGAYCEGETRSADERD